jgi:hypothetical protein
MQPIDARLTTPADHESAPRQVQSRRRVAGVSRFAVGDYAARSRSLNVRLNFSTLGATTIAQ